MLQLSQNLYNIPIMSLRTGGQVGIAIRPILNPDNLKVEGWYAQDKFSGQQLVLPAGEVRDIIRQGIVVNDHDAMTSPEELVRLNKVIGIRFEALGKPVVTEKGRKLGKVEDFSYDTESFFIQRLYVSPPIIKSFSGSQTMITRLQIVEITDKKIVVTEPLATADLKAAVPA
jgi:uncharacterized protein YrrD